MQIEWGETGYAPKEIKGKTNPDCQTSARPKTYADGQDRRGK